MAIILTAYPSSLEVTQGEHILEGGIRNYDVEFRFPENDTTWRDMALVGVFKTDLGEWAAFLDLETKSCKIPWEALDEGSAGSSLTIGLYGVMEDDHSVIVRSTVWAAMPFRILPGPDAEPAQEPSPSLFQQIMSSVSQVVQRMNLIQTIEKTVFNIANQVTKLHKETEENTAAAKTSAQEAEASAVGAQESATESAASAAQAAQTLTETRDVLALTEEVLAETRRVYESTEDVLEDAEQVLAQTKTAQQATEDVLAQTKVVKGETEAVLTETRTVLAETEGVLDETKEVRDDALEAELGAESAQAGAEQARDQAQDILEDTRDALTEAQNARDEAKDTLEQIGTAVNDAAEYATMSKSWAVGGTGLRTGEDTNNAKYYAQRAKDIAGGLDIVIGDTMPNIWPVLWFNTSGVIQPSDNEMLLLLGEWTEESDVQAEVDGDLYSVENAVINGEPTEDTYSFDVI